MAWLLLFVAGIFEIIWAIALNFTKGFQNIIPAIITVSAMLLSIYLLSLSLKSIPIGVAYAAWTGIGIAGTSIASIYLLHEPISYLKLFFIFLIGISIVGLKLSP